MDLKTNIQVNSEANLGPLQNVIKEVSKATVATNFLSKAQKLLGKNTDEINDFTKSYVLSLGDLLDTAKKIPDRLREIGSEQNLVNKIFESFVNSNSLPSYTQFAESAKELATNINDTSRATGIAVNDMSKLANFAHQNGLEFDTLNDLLVTLAQNLGEVAQGEGEDMEKALNALGVSSKDASGKVREALPVFLDISRAFDKYQDGVTKSALAGKILDEEGTKYIGAISKAHRAFADLNPIMGSNFVAVVQSAGKATKDLNLAFSQLGAEIGTRLMPITTAITNIVTKFIKTLLQLPKPIKDIIVYIGLAIASFGTFLLVINTVTTAISVFKVALNGAILAIKGFASIGFLTKGLGVLTGAIQAAAAPLAPLMAGLSGVNTTMAGTSSGLSLVRSALMLLNNPITAIIAGIVAIGVVLYASNQNFRNWVNGIGRLVGTELYYYIVGASVMFKQFVADVGTQLSRVGQGLSDFFGKRVVPVLAGVVEGLVTMFNGFFGWIFDGFNAVAGKIIDLYNLLPEAVRNVLGQIGSFSANIISNMPIFRQTQKLIQYVQGIKQRGVDVVVGNARQKDIDAMNQIRGSNIKKPELIPIPEPTKPITTVKPKPEPTTGKPTKPKEPPKPVTPTKPKDTGAQDAKKHAAALKDSRSSINDLSKDVDRFIQDLKAKSLDLSDTLRQILISFDGFVESNNKIVAMKFPTMAETIKTKYTELFEILGIDLDKIISESRENYSQKVKEIDDELEEIFRKFKDATGQEHPDKPNIKNILTRSKERLKSGFENMATFEEIIKSIETILPKLQEDFENILNPQIEQLKTAQENKRVLEETVKLMKTGLNEEDAKTLALNRLNRQESFDGLQELINQATERRKKLNVNVVSADAINSLDKYIALLEETKQKWSDIGNRIDNAAIETKKLEKKQRELAEKQERNKQIAQGVAQAIGQGLGQVFDLLFTKTENFGQALLNISAGILKTIADQMLQIMVIAPIVNSLTKGFGKLLGVSFAQGGVMTDRGPMPLKTYARGGIATSPQLTLFGEGRMPEAFVPLPDGRRIPVAMQGNGGGGGDNISVNVNVDASGSQVSGNPGQGDQLGHAIAQAVQLEIVKQKRPGGLLYA